MTSHPVRRGTGQQPSRMVVPLSMTTEQPSGETGQPVEASENIAVATNASGQGDISVVELSVPEAAAIAQKSRQRILKLIDSGRLPAQVVICEGGYRKGQKAYRIQAEDLFQLYPMARVEYEKQQADLSVKQPETPSANFFKGFKREEKQVILRANPETMTRAQAAMNARMRFLSIAIQTPLREVPEIERRRGIPGRIVAQAIAWLVGSMNGLELLRELGKVPSSDTILRWWQAFCEDPTGLALQPKGYAAGRSRLTEKIPGLKDEILGAVQFAHSFRGAADVLRARGINISENTVRRVMAQVPQSVTAATVKGDKKSLHDYGPYVRRSPSLPFQCWSIDGHTWDAETLWDEPLPGEVLKTFRPHLYVVRDVGSGAILSCQIGGKGLNRYLALQALAEAMLRWGVIPETIQPDNGSEVCNRLFEGDEQDLIGYWDQLGMDWKNGTALVHHALPYNSRSKPVERDFRIFTERFAARLPAYVGNSPSTRPGAPLKAALEAGALETVASLKTKLYTWLSEWNTTDRTIQRHRINPNRALLEQRDNLIQQLGADHPRFIRPGQEWRVLPSLKARKVRELVCCRIEGEEFRYSSPVLVGTEVDGLTVRINPWDVTQAWLCRGGQLLDVLEFVPDGPALGAGSTDVVALRMINNINSRLKTTMRNARDRAEAIQAEADMRGLRIGKRLVATLEEQPRQAEIDTAELERQKQQWAEDEKKARQRPEDPVDRYQRLVVRTRPEALTEEDRDWLRNFETTPEGKALRDALKDFRRDGAAD